MRRGLAKGKIFQAVQIRVSLTWLGFPILLLWIAASGCSRETPTQGSPRPARPEAPPSPSATNVASHSALPQIGGPPGYVGSSACRSCHQDQFESWRRTYHRTMTQIASTNGTRAKFDGTVLTNENTRFTLYQKAGELWVRMEEIAPSGPFARATLDARMGLITGSHHMQVFWVGDEEHNCQIGFPFTWLIPEQRWVPRNSTFIRPPNTEHRPETWNHVCARCHATGSEPNLDRGTRTFHTRVGELGIACEACHGPGERHAQQEREWQQIAEELRPKDRDLAIVHPEKIEPARASQICGFCHSMKWWDRGEGWPERGFSYRPGDDLEKTTPVIRPNQIDKQPWLSRVLTNNPEIFRDFFWADGMIRVSGREYNGLIESPCYKGGQFSCLSCHSLHQSDPDDQLAWNRKDHRACTQCHAQFRDELELVRHTRHLANSSGSDCYNCHMPHTTYGVLKAIRAHQISSPKVWDELATGRPNACNLCHLDKTLAWTAEHLNRWFGHAPPSLSDQQSTVADSVRLALTGDAGQRALLAWHLGWQPARAASGEQWIPPILAHLLDDPYAAIRCVAERSLKQMGGPVPSNYDFTLLPDQRPPARDSSFEIWARSLAGKAPTPVPAETLVRPDNASETRQALERLFQQRNDTPVRLRE